MNELSENDLHTLRSGMTVRDLIDELSHLDPEAVVVFACDYGDICHTQQALPVSSAEELDPDEHRIDSSAYSQSGLAVERVEDEEDDLPDEDYDGPVVVVLR